MGKIQDRLSILEVLAGATEPMRPSDIGDIVGFDPLKTCKILTIVGIQMGACSLSVVTT